MNLDDLRGWMTGEDCMVVGCGPSAKVQPKEYDELQDAANATRDLADNYYDHWTIGCNRSVTFCSPDFVLCVEPYREQKLWQIIRDASPLIVFSHLNDDRPKKPTHRRIVNIGSKDVLEWLESQPRSEEFVEVLDRGIITRVRPSKPRDPLRLGQSAFFAAAVAILLGFETIGLIGVDLSIERYAKDMSRENKEWKRLADVATDMGSRIINLSPDSRLTSVEHGTWGEVRRK